MSTEIEGSGRVLQVGLHPDSREVYFSVLGPTEGSHSERDGWDCLGNLFVDADDLLEALRAEGLTV